MDELILDIETIPDKTLLPELRPEVALELFEKADMKDVKRLMSVLDKVAGEHVHDWHSRRARVILQSRAAKGEISSAAKKRLQEIYRNDKNREVAC